MDLQIKTLCPEVIYLNFDEQDHLVDHFTRFSEWYESSNRKFYRKDFTKAEAIIDYKKSRGLNYEEVSQAFNLPFNAIEEAGKVLSNLSAEELFILDIIKHQRAVNPRAQYLIAAYGEGTDNERAHEVAHALYYIDPYYRAQMDQLIDELPLPIRDAMMSYLKTENYNEAVYKDEAQAYLSTGLDDMPKIKQVQKYRTDFIDTFLSTARKHQIGLWD